MDLQAAHGAEGRRWSLIKVTAVVCFVFAGGLLLGSLLSAKASTMHPQASLLSVLLELLL
jgi:hypothetical protein